MILPMFYFNTLNMYSGTALYDSWLIMSYNVAWTALPIVVLGIFDKDIPCDFVHKFPRLY